MKGKTNPQCRLFHAMAAEFSRLVKFDGRRWKPESWKRILVEAWIQTEKEAADASGLPDPYPELVMLKEGLQGGTLVQLGAQVRRLTKDQMTDLIDSTYALGYECGIDWVEIDECISDYND
jgi:hypothetical protein